MMTPNINLSPEVYREVGQYGNRDESWNTVIERLVKHVDEEAVLEDKNGRYTTSENTRDSSTEADDDLAQLDDGTRLRHRYQRGDYSGRGVEAEVQGGRVYYDGEKTSSPSSAAVKADEDVRGEDGKPAHNGWLWWEYQVEGDEWRRIDDLR